MGKMSGKMVVEEVVPEGGSKKVWGRWCGRGARDGKYRKPGKTHGCHEHLAIIGS
jgi:hypothetical protein